MDIGLVRRLNAPYRADRRDASGSSRGTIILPNGFSMAEAMIRQFHADSAGDRVYKFPSHMTEI
ncbi:MAG: hypothetical protein WCH83_02675 [Alphaproteobacteria bacterium]